ncbi:MAG: hypothetical protein QM763_15715 [Agriterribacter sp.]
MPKRNKIPTPTPANVSKSLFEVISPQVTNSSTPYLFVLLNLRLPAQNMYINVGIMIRDIPATRFNVLIFSLSASITGSGFVVGGGACIITGVLLAAIS